MMKTIAGSMTALAFALVCSLSGQTHKIRPAEIALCLHPGVGNRVTDELAQQIKKLSAVMPMSLEMEASGEVSLRAGSDPSFAPLAALCRSNGVALMPVARNFKPAAMLSNRQAPERVARALVDWAKREHFDGYLIDIEHHTVAQRGEYHHFISNVSRVLRSNGLKLQVAVSPFDGGEWDYASVAGQVDRVFAMLYDYGAPWNPRPGATAPLSWPVARRDVNRDTARLLAAGVPPSKLLLGLAFYGTHYEMDPSGKTVKARQVYFEEQKRLIQEAKSRPDWVAPGDMAFDAVAGNYAYTLTFKDGSRVQGWTEEAAAHRLRLDKVRLEGLAGVGIWSLIEKAPHDPSAWALLGDFKDGREFPAANQGKR